MGAPVRSATAPGRCGGELRATARRRPGRPRRGSVVAVGPWLAGAQWSARRLAFPLIIVPKPEPGQAPPGRASAGAAAGAQHDVVDVVRGGSRSGRTRSLLVDLDVPRR